MTTTHRDTAAAQGIASGEVANTIGIRVTEPPLRFLHSAAVLSQVKLGEFRKMATDQLIESLRPGLPGALKARPDGTVLEGHHRLAVLRERGVDTDTLPRELVPQETES
jgi:hypothetical protein